MKIKNSAVRKLLTTPIPPTMHVDNVSEYRPHSVAQHPLLSVDGTKVAVVTIYNRLNIWDTYTGKKLQTLPIEPSSVGSDLIRDMVFSPDLQKYALNDGKGIVIIVDTTTGRKMASIPADIYDKVSFSFNGDRLLVIRSRGANQGTISVWDSSTGECFTTILPSERYAAFDFYDKYIAVLPKGSTSAQIWSVKEGTLLYTLSDTEPLSNIDFSPRGTKVQTKTASGIKIWDVATGKLLFSSPYDKDFSRGILNLDETKVAIIGSSVRIFELATGKLLSTIPSDLCILSSDGRYLIGRVKDDKRLIGIWSIATGNRIKILKASQEVYQIASSDDVSHVVAITSAGTTYECLCGSKHDGYKEYLELHPTFIPDIACSCKSDFSPFVIKNSLDIWNLKASTKNRRHGTYQCSRTSLKNSISSGS